MQPMHTHTPLVPPLPSHCHGSVLAAQRPLRKLYCMAVVTAESKAIHAAVLAVIQRDEEVIDFWETIRKGS